MVEVVEVEVVFVFILVVSLFGLLVVLFFFLVNVVCRVRIIVFSRCCVFCRVLWEWEVYIMLIFFGSL